MDDIIKERLETARRNQKIMTTISGMIAEAKALLLDAKQIGKDAGLEISFDQLFIELGVDQNWYSSDPDHC